MRIIDVDFGSLERMWKDRARRVAQVRKRSRLRGMTRPVRDSAERRWLEARGRTGPFVEVRAARGRKGKA